jgi:hypothetical protein
MEEVYTEPKQIRTDMTILLGWKVVEKSGLIPDEKVVVKTELGSGKIVIERLNKGGSG